MDEDVRVFGTELGCRAIARDWPGVHAMLAPWMQKVWPVEAVQKFFEDAYLEILKANQVQGMHYPEYPEPEVGGNSFTNATELGKPISFLGGKVRPVAPEVTNENMRYWLKLQLQCSDEQMAKFGFDYLCEAWMAVVATADGLRVGYWSQGAY